MYTDNIPDFETLNKETGLGISTPSQHEATRFYVRLSQLADRYIVKGIDDMVAPLVFDNINSAVFTRIDGDWPCLIRRDLYFLHCVRIMFENARHSGSEKALQIIVSFVVDHVHYLRKSPEWRELIEETEGLERAICRELLDGSLRLMCPLCGLVFSGIVDDLGSASDFRFPEDTIMECQACRESATRSTFVRMWYADEEMINEVRALRERNNREY